MDLRHLHKKKGVVPTIGLQFQCREAAKKWEDFGGSAGQFRHLVVLQFQ